MKTDKEIETDMDAAEAEIKAVLKKYNLELGMLYDDGVAFVLNHTQRHPDGGYSVREREADF